MFSFLANDVSLGLKMLKLEMQPNFTLIPWKTRKWIKWNMSQPNVNFLSLNVILIFSSYCQESLFGIRTKHSLILWMWSHFQLYYVNSLDKMSTWTGCYKVIIGLFEGLIKNEVEFWRVIKKSYCGISMGLWFWPYIFQRI